MMKKFALLSIFVSVIGLAKAQIPTKPDDIRPLLVGMTAPNSILQDAKNGTVNLSDLLAQKPTVLIFYRGGWCPFCNRQLKGIQEVQAELIQKGYQIIGISPDKMENIKKSSTKLELSYTLLSDSKMIAAQAFGIAYQDQNYGKMLETASGESHHLLPVPSVFVIDTKGRIRFEYVNPDFKERLDSKVLLAACEAAK